MKNIDRLRHMSTKELAAFLDDCGAETPPDICDYCDGCQNGEDCKYQSDGTAWENWLERNEKTMSFEQEKMIVGSLPSLYPLQKFEEEAINALVSLPIDDDAISRKAAIELCDWKRNKRINEGGSGKVTAGTVQHGHDQQEAGDRRGERVD